MTGTISGTPLNGSPWATLLSLLCVCVETNDMLRWILHDFLGVGGAQHRKSTPYKPGAEFQLARPRCHACHVPQRQVEMMDGQVAPTLVFTSSRVDDIGLP